jgi:hypothetical protein
VIKQGDEEEKNSRKHKRWRGQLTELGISRGCLSFESIIVELAAARSGQVAEKKAVYKVTKLNACVNSKSFQSSKTSFV